MLGDAWDSLLAVVADVLFGRKVSDELPRRALEELAVSAHFGRFGRKKISDLDPPTRDAILDLGVHPLDQTPLEPTAELDHLEWHWLKRVALDGQPIEGGPAAYLEAARVSLRAPQRAIAVLGTDGGRRLYVESGEGASTTLAVLDLGRKYIRTFYPARPGKLRRMARSEESNGQQVLELIPRLRKGAP